MLQTYGGTSVGAFPQELMQHNTSARRVGDVDQCMSRMGASLDQLHSTAKELVERLQAVIGPERPQPQCAEAKGLEPQCRLSSEVFEYTGRINSVTELLQMLLARVEV